MLVLTLARKSDDGKGDYIELRHRSGDRITVRIVDFWNGKARLAFGDDPDRNFKLLRRDVIERDLASPSQREGESE